MKNDTIIPDETLASKIYFFRKQKVMLDKDLAALYGVKAFRLREQVKRNKERFPRGFMFQLNKVEVEIMVSQNAIPSKQHLGGTLPYAFTEHGVLMLANVLRSKRAIQMSIRIIELFIRLRETILTNQDILLKVERMERQVISNREDISELFSQLRKLLHQPEKPKTRIGFHV